VAAAAHEPRAKAAAVTEQILICYDGSNEAKRAVDTAAALLGPRHAVVLNVAPAITFAEGMATTSALVPGSAFEGLSKADALLRAEAGAARARRAGLDAEPRVTPASSTWKGIVDVADELDAEIIVIGSRGLSGFRELAHRSVSHDVAVHARQPVLIVPPVTT
jgi:nucleotide-binding universal stress UspA family protein